MHPDQVILGKVVAMLVAMQHKQYRALDNAINLKDSRFVLWPFGSVEMHVI